MIKSENYIVIPFVKNGVELIENAPQCVMTVKSAGSMRFRWNENNQNRNNVLKNLSKLYCNSAFVPVQLDHTHIVYDVKKQEDTKGLIGDGIITVNKSLIPTITVADCVPIFLYEPDSGVFGVVHSGWKGTGIIADAIALAAKNYGARPENFCVTIGPHIHQCCYIVNEERAEYFFKNFTPDCITDLEAGVNVSWNNGGGKLYRLSLEKANLAVIKKAGVPQKNIYVHPDCTCCFNNGFYGSNRRETVENGSPNLFTVQAAFTAWKSY